MKTFKPYNPDHLFLLPPALRKGIGEPVFGPIKGTRGFRRFSFRGLPKVQAEWLLICLTHNLLKLFRAGGGRPRSHERDSGAPLGAVYTVALLLRSISGVHTGRRLLPIG
jgi:DDE family transposase